MSVLNLAYRCSEENNGNEYIDDYDEFWASRSPSQLPVVAEDEDSSSSYRFPLLETFVSHAWV
jgi:hypothetical protein